jgi:hypothetical protein
MNVIARGALAGIIATGPMTIVIVVGKMLGLLNTPPPKQITAEVHAETGLHDEVQAEAFTASWLAAHLGYGAACGALLAATRPLLPKSDLVTGILFGGAVWGVSYAALMPGLGLYPPLWRDRPSRQAVMAAAHGVYGVTLAWTDRRLKGAP